MYAIRSYYDPNYRVGFFVGCGGDFVYPEVGVSLVKVLNSLNVEVIFPKGQNCCGIPALYSGDTETGVELAKQSVDAGDALSIAGADTNARTIGVSGGGGNDEVTNLTGINLLSTSSATAVGVGLSA